MRCSTEHMAIRMANAERNFIETTMDLGGLDLEQAQRALQCYRRLRVVKLDLSIGVYHVVHGRFLDPGILQRAASGAF